MKDEIIAKLQKEVRTLKEEVDDLNEFKLQKVYNQLIEREDVPLSTLYSRWDEMRWDSII